MHRAKCTTTGFWDLLTFGMQMTPIPVTGHGLAGTKPARRIALALLGITGIKARDIIGYTAVVMLFVLPLFLLAPALV